VAPDGMRRRNLPMDKTARRILGTFRVLALATLALLYADPSQPASRGNAASDDQADKNAPRRNVLIIGASSLTSPVELTRLLGAMLESNGIRMNLEGEYPRLDAVNEILGSTKKWDYVVIDAWHLGREQVEKDPARASVPPGFPKAVSAFVKEVRAHSPGCKIILFPWWIPRGPKVTNDGAMEVFRSCVEQAKANELWVATTGPAFMLARLERPDLKITVSKTDAHPGKEGAYINACSLYAIITDKSPVGLPATLEITSAAGKKMRFALAPDDAKYLQELAWKVYQREITNTKPAK
jgi:hypothetical protein